MTRFFIVRHGQTSWNLERKIQGKTDIDLNEEGLSQAERLGRRLADQELHHIYSSPAIRARKTAEAVARFHVEIPFELVDELHEFGMGKIEGVTVEEAHRLYTEAFWDDDVLRVQLGMEKRADYFTLFRERFLPAWKEKHENQNVLLSTHGGKKGVLLRSFRLAEGDLALLEGKHAGNCSLSIVESTAEGDKLVLFADDSHLF